MSKTGKVIKINSELGYGFIQIAKLGDVFFSSETNYTGTSFGSLKINDVVNVDIVETERGLFADAITLEVPAREDRTPEIGL